MFDSKFLDLLYLCCLILLYVLCCIKTTEALQGVRLTSTLRQSALCPGDESTTFSCTASGTELVWIVGGRTLSFNHNAIVGTSRIDSEEDRTATLMRIDNIENNGHAVRLSTLTVSAQLRATEMLSVKCHNGSDNLAEEIQYLPRPADLPAMPKMIATMDSNRVVRISWTAPINSRDLSYYAINVDDDLPMLTQNTSILYYNISSSSSAKIFLRAVDRCEQQGLMATTTLVTPQGNDDPPVTYNGGVSAQHIADRLPLIIFLFLVASFCYNYVC